MVYNTLPNNLFLIFQFYDHLPGHVELLTEIIQVTSLWHILVFQQLWKKEGKEDEWRISDTILFPSGGLLKDPVIEREVDGLRLGERNMLGNRKERFTWHFHILSVLLCNTDPDCSSVTPCKLLFIYPKASTLWNMYLLNIYKLEDIHGSLYDNICLKEFNCAFLSGGEDWIASSLQKSAQNP